MGLIITSQKGFKDTFYSSVFIDDDCVNPGDVNGDGYIDMEDKLYIDFARHTESFNRITTNRKPGRYSCIPWLDTLPNGRNMKHADCDGNGKVYLHEVEPDYPEDDDAVYYNYDSIPRPFKINSDKITDPPLYYKLDKKFYKGGDTVYAKFRIGTYKNPIIEFMGISFTIIIPDSVIDTSRIKVDYDSSYFIDDGDKLFSSRIIKGYNRIDVLCGNNVKGNLTGDFTLIALKLPVKKAVKDSVTVKIQIGNNNQMDNKGNHVPVYVLGDYKNLGIETNGNLFSLIEIYPNPSSGKTYINSSEDNITSITLKSIEGKTVMNIENINQTKTVINTEQLPIGVYLLSVKTAKGTAQRKLILFR
ncbi:MAG: T9SS type A sorting domain-containing protein [Bacteroidetes bacterium]|nr:T9SS type A sorting domain-containing protein [Bacteroidota bacterium]